MKGKVIGIFSWIVLLLGFIQLGSAQNLDIDLLRKINGGRSANLVPFFQGCSNSVTPMVIGVPVVMCASGLLKHDTVLLGKGLFVGTTCIAAGVIAIGVKYAINRPRPFTTYKDIVRLSEAGGPSFPSGHTSAAFSLATGFWLDYPHWYVGVPVFTWASLVGFSRMDLGVHYPSDVLGGIVVGVGSAWVNKKLTDWMQRKNDRAKKILYSPHL